MKVIYLISQCGCPLNNNALEELNDCIGGLLVKISFYSTGAMEFNGLPCHIK